jgi:hypothetical protein
MLHSRRIGYAVFAPSAAHGLDLSAVGISYAHGKLISFS